MRKPIAYIAFLLVSVISFGQVPDMELQSATDNKWYNVEDLKGENVTVIDFWATWCKPCITALPKLNKLYEEFDGKGVQFIGISTDSPRNHSKVRPFISTHGISYPVLRDPNMHLMDEVNASVLPTLLIYDKEGKLVYLHEGFSPGTEIELKEAIEKALNN